jgi:hypothetical protein
MDNMMKSVAVEKMLSRDRCRETKEEAMLIKIKQKERNIDENMQIQDGTDTNLKLTLTNQSSSLNINLLVTDPIDAEKPENKVDKVA